MLGEKCFEVISAGAISKVMPTCKGIIINIGEQNHITEHLSKTFTNIPYKIYIVDTSFEKLSKVLKRCSENNIPAIINCGQDLPQISKFIEKEEDINATCICAGSNDSSKDIVNFLLKSSNISKASFIAFQSYYFSPDNLLSISSKYFEQMRLGMLRNNITLCEPILRDNNYVFVDFNSVRFSDFSCNTKHYPNGLYAEEICQIARYIGFSQKLKAVFLFSEPLKENNSINSNKLIAEVLWHICDGLASNVIEKPNNDNSRFIKKFVQLDYNGENIVFINSLLTDRWWMEIPSEKGTILIPCSKEEYNTACRGEVPLRWLFFYQKYNIL